MAQAAKKAKPKHEHDAASAKAQQPSRPRTTTAIFGLAFGALSVVFLWLMRIETALKDIPVGFIQQVESRTYANGLPIRTRYTGVAAVDSLHWLVAAFIAGPLNWDAGVRLQQMHFFVQLLAIIAVWNVEACRVRNSGRLISFTALFAILYQLIGGAVIAPLYYLAWALVSAPNRHYTSGRAVPLPYARGLLFSHVVGYLVPTLGMYLIPGLSAETVQLLTFIWQPAPILVNVLLAGLAFVFPSSSSSTTTAAAASASSKNHISKESKTKMAANNDDAIYLKRMYLVVGLVCAISHIWTMATCLTSRNPQHSLSYVFLPNRDVWTQSTVAGLHYIFQVDWWGCFGPTLLWCWLAVYDVHRLLLGDTGVTAQILKWAAYIVVSGVIVGPGATLALVWSWREDRLIMIELGVRGTVRKPKTA